MKVLVTQSCLTLSDPRDCSLPGFSVHGIFLARILMWAIPFSRGSSYPRPPALIKPRSPALQADSSLSEPPGKPIGAFVSHQGGFSCRARALGVQASVVAALGLGSCASWAPECGFSSYGTWA